MTSCGGNGRADNRQIEREYHSRRAPVQNRDSAWRTEPVAAIGIVSIRRSGVSLGLMRDADW